MMLRRAVTSAALNGVHRSTSTTMTRSVTSGAARITSGLGVSSSFARSAAAVGSGASSASWFSSDVSLPKPPTSNHEHTPLAGAQGSIIYTETDEAPALATYSLYPVIKKVRKIITRNKTKSQKQNRPHLLFFWDHLQTHSVLHFL